MRNALIASLFKLDPKELRVLTAVRCTLAVAVCMLGYWKEGQLAWGVLAGLGSLYVGLSSFTGVYQTRLRAMAVTTLFITLLTIVGTLVSVNVWASIAAVVAFGFFMGLYAAMRPNASSLATIATATLIILSKVLKTPGDTLTIALGNGLLILTGGVSQILSLSLFWPVTRFHPERRAVADVYDSLADFAGKLAQGVPLQMMEGQSLIEARELMESLNRYRLQPEQIALRRAMSCAEGIRAGLVGITSLSSEERMKSATHVADLSARLKEVARSIREGEILALPNQPVQPKADETVDAADPNLIVASSLLDILRQPVAGSAKPSQEPDHWTTHLSFRLIALGTSRSLRIMALQHSLRLAAALFITMCISRFAPVGNGYWIPLTACLILRTDYATTLERGMARAVGTFAGVLLAIGIGQFLPAGPATHIPIVILATFGFFAVFRANYTLYSVLVTLWVLFSLAAAGVPERLVGWYRLIATVIGTLIAFTAYRILPTWQSDRVKEVLREATQSQIDFCESVLSLPEFPSRKVWEGELHKTRALRYEAETVIESARKEPVWRKSGWPEVTHRLLLNLEKNAANLLVIVARRLASPSMTNEVRERVAASIEEAQAIVTELQRDQP